MAIRYSILMVIRRGASWIAFKADLWAQALVSARGLTGSVTRENPRLAPAQRADISNGPYELIPLTNREGQIEAGLLSYGLDESSQIIERLRQEELHGTGMERGSLVNRQVGDTLAGLTPMVMTGLRSGQLYQVIGPPSVVQGLANGTMQMVPSKIGGSLGAVTQGSSQFAGQARFLQVSSTSVVAPLMIYQAVHMIVGTQQINEINRRLASIDRTLEKMLQRQNAKDLGEVIAAASTLRDILEEHQHSGHFNAQMRDRLSHCERDLRAHLERLKLLQAQFHSKVEAARARSRGRDRSVQLATLIKQEGDQFGQDTRLLIALCGAVMQLEQGLTAIALEHHPESLPHRQKQMKRQMEHCKEALKDMVNLSEVQVEIRVCLEKMNWWQCQVFDRNAASTLKQANGMKLETPPTASQALPEGNSGGMLVWMDEEKGIQVRALNPEPAVVSEEHPQVTWSEEWPEPKHLALAPSSSLRVGETYRLPITDLDSEVPIRILRKTGHGEWIGMRMDTPDIEHIEILVDDD